MLAVYVQVSSMSRQMLVSLKEMAHAFWTTEPQGMAMAKVGVYKDIVHNILMYICILNKSEEENNSQRTKQGK